MAGADTNRPRLTRLARRRQLIQEQEEAAEKQEKDNAKKKHKGVLKKEKEKLPKREEVLKKPKKHRKRIRAIVKRRASGSSSPPQLLKLPRQLPPPGPATHIHQLPDEVLGMIFAPLNLKTIAKVVTVCQRWQGVVEDRYLNKELVLEGPEVTTEEALSLIGSARELKSLDLVNRYDTVALLDAVSNRCTNLLHLAVVVCNAGVSLTEVLRKVFWSSPRISDLTLLFVIVDNGLQFCQELGTALPDLCKLRLGLIGTCYELDVLINSLSRNEMEEFKDTINYCSDAHVAKLVQVWGRSLRVLEMEAGRLTDDTLARLVGCSELRRLRLSNLSIRGEGLCDLATLSHLEELDVLNSSAIKSDTWCRFFSQSRSSHGLRKLSLQGWCRVDNRVLASVAAFCPQLEELEVDGEDLTISGVREVLRCCHKLHNLRIEGVDGRVARIVLELPQLAPQLRRIRIGYYAKCRLGKATLRRVQAQMPHLEIE